MFARILIVCTFLQTLGLSFDSAKSFGWVFIIYLQNFASLVQFLCMLGVGVEVRKKNIVHVSVHWEANSF